MESGESQAEQLTESDAQLIVEECYDDVLAYCRRHAPRGNEAADLAQETFLRFVRSGGSGRYANEGKPLAYLLAIARNLCIDAARSSRFAPYPTTFGMPSGEREDGGGESSERHRTLDVVDPHDDIADIELACVLEQLDDESREVIELSFDQGLGVVEVARVLNISRFAVRRRLKRALQEVEETLAPRNRASRSKEGTRHE